MYVQKFLEENRVDVLHDLIRAYPLGTIVTSVAGGVEANHIPFEVYAEPPPFGVLRAHVARANPLWRTFAPEIDTLVVFHGPSAYISPSWYPSRAATGKVAPTWNYAVVHAYGRLRVVDDRAWIRRNLEDLVAHHEARRENPWKISEAPAEFVEALIDRIVGIEIPVSRLIGKWQLNQQRPAADRDGAIAALRRQDSDAAAALADLAQRAAKND